MQPLATPTLATAIPAVFKEEPTTIRVGRITHYDSAQVTVEISGTSVTANGVYLSSYVPVLGDYVMLVWQGGSLLVLGALNGEPPGNTVTNWSFENSATGSAPADWGAYPASGTSTLTVLNSTDGFEIDGRQVLRVLITSAGGNTQVYSQPIPVTPGEAWSAAAQATAEGNGTDVVGASVYIAWEANQVDVPPTYVSLEYVSSRIFSGISPIWYQLRGGGDRGGKIAPVGAAYARVVLQTTSTGINSDVLWDRVTFRKIG